MTSPIRATPFQRTEHMINKVRGKLDGALSVVKELGRKNVNRFVICCHGFNATRNEVRGRQRAIALFSHDLPSSMKRYKACPDSEIHRRA